MAQLVIVVAVILLLVFGCSSIMDSYEGARQAQATIEVAKVAQTQAWANMISILALALVILLIVFAVLALVFLAVRFQQVRAETRPVRLSLRRREINQLPSPPELDQYGLSPEEVELVRQILEL